MQTFHWSKILRNFSVYFSPDSFITFLETLIISSKLFSAGRGFSEELEKKSKFNPFENNSFVFKVT